MVSRGSRGLPRPQVIRGYNSSRLIRPPRQWLPDGREIELPAGCGPKQEVGVSKLLDRIGRAAFVLGVVVALGFGAQTAVAASQTRDCQCVPPDNQTCITCCGSDISICPPTGTEPRECLCG